MSLYQAGTVNMTNNSAAVVGVGTAFVANVTAGDGFLISGETIYYTVLSITDDTHLTLSVVYAGVTGNGKAYQISRDWTVNLGLAEIQPGDPNWPYLLTQKVIRLLDAGVQSVLTNSAALAAALGDETGTGFVVFNNAPTLIAPALGAATCASIYAIADMCFWAQPVTGTDRVQGFKASNAGGYFTAGVESSAGGAMFTGTSAYAGVIGVGGSGSGPLQLCTNNAVRMTIDFSTGNVGIGTATPTVQFELSGSVGQKASGTTWSNPSDARLKDIQGPADLQRCYDDVKALELKRYRVKDDCFTNDQIKDRTVTGLVAGDVQKIIPKAVNVVPFTKVPIPDGVEEYEEQEEVTEEVSVNEVEIVAGQPVLKLKMKSQKKALADEVQVKDEKGKPVRYVDKDGKEKPLMHSIPRMVKKTRPKERKEVIEDCLNLDMSQVYMQMFGAVQMLIQKVEALEAKQ